MFITKHHPDEDVEFWCGAIELPSLGTTVETSKNSLEEAMEAFQLEHHYKKLIKFNIWRRKILCLCSKASDHA